MGTDQQPLFDAVWQRRTAFLVVFSAVLALSYAVLVVIDFVPEAPATTESLQEETGRGGDERPAAGGTVKDDPDRQSEPPVIRNEAGGGLSTPGQGATAAPPRAPLPQTIIIDRLDKVLPVNNPSSRTVADLDEALLTGTVRHPDSATFTNKGNIFILGHSSYLPNVFNEHFQDFNGIQNLRWGDIIRLRSLDTEYVYRVEKVYEAKASAVTVPIAGTGPRLTLATCNSFAGKDDRFIVESKLIETRPL